MQNAELKLFPFDAQDVITASTPIVADNLFRFSGFDDNTPKNLSVTYNGNTIFDRTKTPDASINVFFAALNKVNGVNVASESYIYADPEAAAGTAGAYSISAAYTTYEQNGSPMPIITGFKYDGPYKWDAGSRSFIFEKKRTMSCRQSIVQLYASFPQGAYKFEKSPSVYGAKLHRGTLIIY